MKIDNDYQLVCSKCYKEFEAYNYALSNTCIDCHNEELANMKDKREMSRT